LAPGGQNTPATAQELDGMNDVVSNNKAQHRFERLDRQAPELCRSAATVERPKAAPLRARL
jgi:hypothetical protein